MVVRARLAPIKPEAPTQWLWHDAKFTSLASSIFLSGERRMEAETYLTSGYGLRLALQSHSDGWRQFGEFVRIWQPSRLKGIQVSKRVGTPFLAATQVFDIRPIPRKWLALEKTSEAAERMAQKRGIVVTCSGAVGRATILHSPHEGMLISHDLLRVDSVLPEHAGWVYAFLRSRQGRAMMTSAKYGHMIKHLEVAHLNALPIPLVSAKTYKSFLENVQKIVSLRDEAHQLSIEAEQLFEKCIGALTISDWGETGYSTTASKAMFSGRRRFEGVYHNPGVAEIYRHLAKHGKSFSTLKGEGFNVWLPTRFKRIPAEEGVWLLDSADLFETNPDLEKRIADIDFGDGSNGRVKAGWLLLARSGQTYGLNGTLVIATEALEGCVVSDHVIRISPDSRSKSSIRVGYLHTALSHPTLGRPLVKSLAYGSSIPEIDPTDFSLLRIVRLSPHQEDRIADLAERSSQARAQADILERQMSDEASALIDDYIAGKNIRE